MGRPFLRGFRYAAPPATLYAAVGDKIAITIAALFASSFQWHIPYVPHELLSLRR